MKPTADPEQGLRALLGAATQLPEARLRQVREAVFASIARREPALPPWLRWRLALPAALSLLLLGGALGWNAGDRIAAAQDLDLFGAMLVAVPGGAP